MTHAYKNLTILRDDRELLRNKRIVNYLFDKNTQINTNFCDNHHQLLLEKKRYSTPKISISSTNNRFYKVLNAYTSLSDNYEWK